jgi:GTPase Era involved in 16S rRNA processing
MLLSLAKAVRGKVQSSMQSHNNIYRRHLAMRLDALPTIKGMRSKSPESFVLFDTVGLDEATTGTVSKAEENLKSLLQELMSTTDGIGLLVYCVRSTRVCHALIRNYKIFYSAICRNLKIPIVLVVTGLENHRPTMESWWDINWQQFRKHGMHFEDHACVTTLSQDLNTPGVSTQRIVESSEILRKIIINKCSASRLLARTVIIFGESGSGKSSVINAIAQQRLSETSGAATGCTFHYQCHSVEVAGQRFVFFDTTGFEGATGGAVSAAKAEKSFKSLLRELMNASDGIGLLVYCVRGRVSRALLHNYNLFYSAICRKKVPIVIVVTGLENQEPTMDSWWDVNGKEFERCGMHFEDYACVTTLRKDSNIPDVFTPRITESRENLRRLILNNCTEWAVDDSWFRLSMAEIRSMINDGQSERSSPPTLIICDPSQKEVEIAHGSYGDVETFSTRIGGVKYQVHRVPDPLSSSHISSIEADLLIFYAYVDEFAARKKFGSFCAVYRGNMVPVIVVVKGLDNNKAAQEWVERHLMHAGAGRPFSTFAPAGDLRDSHAEQELRELIQRSCLIRREMKGGGIHKRFVQILGK